MRAHGEAAQCNEESLYVSPKLEHLTPDRWLISHATRLPSQIIIRQHLESERFGFPLPVCSYWDMTECLRMHAAAGDRGAHCLALIVLPLCNQDG